MVQQVFNFPYKENTNTDFCINKISLEQKRDFLHSLTGYGDGTVVIIRYTHQVQYRNLSYTIGKRIVKPKLLNFSSGPVVFPLSRLRLRGFPLIQASARGFPLIRDIVTVVYIYYCKLNMMNDKQCTASLKHKNNNTYPYSINDKKSRNFILES